jgi:hypothetical protein
VLSDFLHNIQDLKNNDDHLCCFTATSFPECVTKQSLLASQLTIVHKPSFTMRTDYVFKYVLKSPGHFIIQVSVKKLEATSNKLSGKPYTELRWDKQRKQKLETNKSYMKTLSDIVTKILSKKIIQKFQLIITLRSTSIHFR